MTTKKSLPDEEILRRIPRARAQEEEDRETGLRAVKAFYDAINELVMIETTRGFRWGIPKARIPAIAKASAEQLVQLTLSPSGDGIHWEALDVQLSVPGLLVDALGAGTLAKELARRGGKSTSDAKSDAARRNGVKGGRPSKTQPGKFVVKEAGGTRTEPRPAIQGKSIKKGAPSSVSYGRDPNSPRRKKY